MEQLFTCFYVSLLLAISSDCQVSAIHIPRMIFYLLLTALAIPVQLWSSFIPHLNSFPLMRIGHGAAIVLLSPCLVNLLEDLMCCQQPKTRLILFTATSFLLFASIVNIRSYMFVNSNFGQCEHLLLSGALVCVLLFYFLRPDD